MEAIFVGIDVSKDKLDVHVRPAGEAFAVSRDGKGLEELVDPMAKIGEPKDGPKRASGGGDGFVNDAGFIGFNFDGVNNLTVQEMLAG